MDNENNQDTTPPPQTHIAESAHTPEHPGHPHPKHGKINPELKNYLIVALVYLIISLVAFAYVTMNMSSVTTGIGGDAYLNLWDIWWVNYATYTLHTSFWATNLVYYPIGENLVYHTLAPLTGLIAAPFALVSLPFAYNTMFFLGFAFSGLGMYILADYFVKNRYAAFLAGIFFSFSATHIDHALGLLIFTQVEWIPLSLYFFIRMIRDKKPAYAVGLGLSVMLATFMGTIEQTIMICILLLLVLALYVIYRETRSSIFSMLFLRNVAIAIVICFVAGIWGFLPLINTITQPGALGTASIENTAQYNMLWSADLLTFFVPSYYNSIFYPALANSSLYLPDPAERIAYIGYVVLALSFFALYKNFKSSRMWLAIAVVFALLSLGPSLLVNGYSTGIPTLYNLYHAIPAINVIREPGRFSIITALGFAMLAAFGAKYLLEKEGKTFGIDKREFAIVATAAITFLYLLEVNGLVLIGPVVTATTTQIVNPIVYSQLANLTGNFSILTLPALPSAGTVPDLYPGMSTYYQALSHRPIVGGLDGRTNTTQLLTLYNIPAVVLAYDLELNATPAYQSVVQQNYTNQTAFALYTYGTAYLAVDKGAFSLPSLDALLGYLENVFGAPVYNDNTTTVFATSNEINKVVFRSYVAFPYLPDWQGVSTYINGSQRALWEPVYPGAVQIYAPYKNATNIQNQIYSKQAQFINTTVGFRAMSLDGAPATMVVGTTNASPGSIQRLATINLTTQLQYYSIRIALPSGPYSSTLFFLVEQNGFSTQQQAIGITNITFSEG